MSSPVSPFVGIIRFGNFEVDIRSGELRRAGVKLKLSGQPFDILVALLEKPGEVVTREELHEKLWSQNTFVDFEHGLNKAINKVREVLGDNADNPRFIETLPRRGYRFLGPAAKANPAVEVAVQPQPVAGENLIGKEISHYRILSVLGSGGMGVVYEAEDIRLGRRVALKFLPEKLACDQKALQRFEREARIASSLNHPNICTIYEVEKFGQQSVIVMELLAGKSLEQRIHEGPFSIDEILDFGIQACDALGAAHAKGIVHRDIKPGNISIVGKTRLKILDFGLAKACPLVAEGQTAEQPLTLAGTIPGTTSYMSPEQVRGEEIDTRSDLFSLGVVLYEMATGQRPFLAKNYVLVMNAILNANPAAPSKLNPKLPAALDAILARALEKDREKRYQDAADIGSELRRLKRGPSMEMAVSETYRPTANDPILASGLTIIRDRFPDRPVEAAEASPSNLPVQQTGFVGREKEVSAAKRLLLRPDVRLITITGPGGIGKTRLALQVASGLDVHFSGGVHFVPLSSQTDPGLVASVIVQKLGIHEAGGQSPLEILKTHLLGSLRAPMLLLLDNFEQLVEAAPTVADLLAAGPNLKIMVTSRAALHVYGEHEFPVPPLSLPDSRSLPPIPELSQYSGVALFLARAAAAKPDFELTRENAGDVTEICVRLDGLPLAIELAAARVKVLSAASMRTRLASRLQLLTGGARDLPQRQQTLRAAIDWSYELLNAAEQRLLRRLSVFSGGCNLEGAEAVCDTKSDLDLDLLDGIASLVDKNLVQKVEPAKGESRFVMLETIREYVLEKLGASGEAAATKRALAAYCLVLAEEVTTNPSGSELADWLERFTLEHDNFRASLDWLIETEEADWGLRLGAALFRFWEMREFLAEGRSRLGKLLQLPGAGAPTKVRARALLAAGVLAAEQGDFPAADVRFRESIEITRQLGDKQGTAVSLNALAVKARDLGDVPLARALFEESLLLWRDLGDTKAVARSLSNLASVVKLQGDYERAHSLYEESLSIFRELGDQPGIAWSMNYQGDVSRDQRDFAAAHKWYEQGLAIFREIGDRWGIAGTLADLGNLAREERHYPRAHSLYRESIKKFQELDHKRGIARLLECFAHAAVDQAESERALRLAGAAAALRQNIGAPLTPAEQAKLEAVLESPRRALHSAAASKAWSEGWAMPVERAIEEVLKPGAGPGFG